MCGWALNRECSVATYSYSNSAATHANAELWPALKHIIDRLDLPERKAFDLGCGAGATGNYLSGLGFDVTGVDLSETGIAIAQRDYPRIRTHIGSVYDDLASTYGTFPLVISLEVIEHCFDPHAFARTFLRLIAPGGVGVLSTPYHGYMKNLALALTGKMESHFTALWPNGHIKFFSYKSLTKLLTDSGAASIKLRRVGRIPPLAKSMIAVVSIDTK
jgi:2-polyprenyl-3-methyl-5-hydroxy-6-metoxy-1,4-benzoquinol methylase